METRKIVIGAVVVLIGLPVVLVLIAAAWIHVLDRTNGAIVSSGRPRSYLLYVPPRYDRAKPTPLVISMHGAAEWPAQQMNLSRWNRLAESQGFIVVYPTRIHANGVSNGGGMAFVLSCTLSDRIAAVGMVAAAQSLPWSWCTDRRPVPMIAFHGTADPIAPYSGGRSPVPPGDLFPNVPTWTANWARRNRCGSNPVDSVVATHVTRREYTHCADHAAVVLYTIRGGGHSWPGGKPLPEWMVGPTSRSVDATSQMWAFFRAHPLQRN